MQVPVDPIAFRQVEFLNKAKIYDIAAWKMCRCGLIFYFVMQDLLECTSCGRVHKRNGSETFHLYQLDEQSVDSWLELADKIKHAFFKKKPTQ